MTCFATNIIAQYIKEKNISIDEIAGATNIAKNLLRRSLCDLNRPLKANEFLAICEYIHIDTQVLNEWGMSRTLNR